MKLARLHIENFGCFGSPGIDILIDNIVVLLGPNDVGKSTVLDAYEAFASMGKKLSPDRFYTRRGDNPAIVEAEFSEISADDIETLGAGWAFNNEQGNQSIRVRWKWASAETDGVKQSFNPRDGAGWVDGGVGGWDTLIQSRIPVPLRISPTSDSSEYESIICNILISTVKLQIKNNANHITTILNEIERLTAEFHTQAVADIDAACAQVSRRVSQVFPGYAVGFEPTGGNFSPESVIGTGSYITIQSPGDERRSLSSRGTGVQRSFLWSALSSLAELGHLKRGKTKVNPEKPRILLIDEPESFLHPPAIRRARDCLYEIATLDGWQVMTTTHSPVFVDVSKPHTTIIRVMRDAENSSRVFQTDKANFTDDEKERLMTVRICDPVISEFFFADHAVIVEGDTEHLVLSNVLERHAPDMRSKYSIINSRGKGNIVIFMKILNQFGTPYTVIHDSDSPKARRNGRIIRNGMWTINSRICEELASRHPDLPPSRLVVHIPDFEGAVFGTSLTGDKPYAAALELGRADYLTSPDLDKLRSLHLKVIMNEHPDQYHSVVELIARVDAWKATMPDLEQALWDLVDATPEPRV